MRKNNVVSLAGKLERWDEVYTSPDGQLYISASNHGRLSFTSAGNTVRLEFVESVRMLSEVSKGIEEVMKTMKNLK